MTATPRPKTAPAKPSAPKTSPKKTSASKRPTAKAQTSNTPTKSTQVKKTPTKKATSKKPTAKKATSKKPTAKKATAKKATAAKASPRRAPFEIAGTRVTAGRRKRIEVPIANLMSGTPVALPMIVVHGKKAGPVVWLSAAIHGDEIGGVEIIRQVMEALNAPSMAGTVIAVPVVNVHGFNTNDRYLPDRRDLNRSFPGSLRGSLASRIASLFMTEVVNRSDVGIDLHTGSDLRTNLPQIRCNIDHAPTRELAEVFGAPIVIDAQLRDGSLRQAAVEADKVMLLFEGGEASRFDPNAIATGTAGVLRVLNHLGVIAIESPVTTPCLHSRSTSWTRASRSGIVHLDARLGDTVEAKQQVAAIYDPFGKRLSRILAKHDGIVIGHTQAPLVNRGDAISNIARIDSQAPQWETAGTLDSEET